MEYDELFPNQTLFDVQYSRLGTTTLKVGALVA